MDYETLMLATDSQEANKKLAADRKKRKKKRKKHEKKKETYKIQELREVRSFIDRMISMAVLALGLLHGRAISASNEFIVVTLRLVITLIALYVIQRYALNSALKSPLHTRVWWKSLYRISTLLQDYFVSIVTYVLNTTLFGGMGRSYFNMTEIARLFLIVSALVFMSDVLPNIRSGAWMHQGNLCETVTDDELNVDDDDDSDDK